VRPGKIIRTRADRLHKTSVTLTNLFAVGALLAMAPLTAASASVITFDSLSAVGNPGLTSLTTQGMTFTSDHFHEVGSPEICAFGGCVNDGSNYIAEEAGILGFPIVMTADSGSSFSLSGFDGAELFLNSMQAATGMPFFPSAFPNANRISVLGMLSAGGTVSAVFSLDGLKDGIGIGGQPDFQSFSLTGFTGLDSVTFSGLTPAGGPGAFALDNINSLQAITLPSDGIDPDVKEKQKRRRRRRGGSLNASAPAVPEPGSALLFGLGLACLGFARRRHGRNA